MDSDSVLWAMGNGPTASLCRPYGMGKDPFFTLAGGLDAALELAATAGPQRAGLFASPSAPVHRQLAALLPGATALGLQRSREFLDRVS